MRSAGRWLLARPAPRRALRRGAAYDPGMRATIATTAVAIASLAASCVSFDGYRLITDGFRFDYAGESAVREDGGTLEPGIAALDVDHRFGVVRLVAGPDPGWSWRAEAWADDAGTAADVLAEVRVVWSETADGLAATLEVPRDLRSDLRGLRSVLEITAPASARLDVVARHSDVRIEGFDGHVDLTAQHGEVTLVALDSVTARGAHGDWTIDGVGSLLDIDSAHGDVLASDVRGSARVVSRHGDVEVLRSGWDGRGGDTVLDSEHGDVTIDVPAGVHAHVQIEHGDLWIRHALPEGAIVAASARFGDVSSDVRVTRIDVPSPAIQARVDHGDLRIQRWRYDR